MAGIDGIRSYVCVIYYNNSVRLFNKPTSSNRVIATFLGRHELHLLEPHCICYLTPLQTKVGVSILQRPNMSWQLNVVFISF